MINRVNFLYILVLILFLFEANSMLRHTPQKEIISVDMESLFKEFVISTANKDISSDDASQEVDVFAKSLAEFRVKLGELANEKNLIILDKKSVLGGVVEQTDHARILLNHIRKKIEGGMR